MDATEIRKYMAELIGTMVLVIFGVGTALFTNCNLVATALAFGLSVVVMSVTIGQISGCHLNPAISLGMALDKRMSWTEFVFYFIFQVIGAIIGAFLVFVIYAGAVDVSLGDLGDYFRDTGFASGINSFDGVNDSAGYAMLVEIILTFIFVLVALGATAKNGMDKFAGLYIGLALTAVHFVGINLTGTSVNPARSIGAAVMGFICDADGAGDVWAFIIAPLIGAVIAWAVWKYVLCDPKSAEA
jgi:aquaporin Z